jgi:hypothetical protein
VAKLQELASIGLRASLIRVPGWSLLLCLAVGFAFGRNTGKVSSELIAKTDTILVAGPAVHDTIVRYKWHEAAHKDSMTKLASQADSISVVAYTLELTRDSLLSIAHDTAAAYDACVEQTDSLKASNRRWKRANTQCALAVGQADSALYVAEGRISQLQPALEDANKALKRARIRPKWGAMALWGTKSPMPVGGLLTRDIGPVIFGVQVQWDTLRVLGGIGLRF